MEQEITNERPGWCIFAYPLGNNVPGSCKGFFRRMNPLFNVDEAGSLTKRIKVHGVDAVLRKKTPCQWLEAFLSGNGGSRSPLGAKGQVQVFQNSHGFGCVELIFQCISQKTSLFEGMKNGFSSTIQLGHLFKAVSDRCNRYFIKGARDFLPVAGNKGDCRTFIKEGGRCLYMTLREIEFAGYFSDMLLVHCTSSSD